MSKSLNFLAAASVAFLASTSVQAGDAAKGEAVFKKCAACHAVGDGAKNKVGPQLNDIIGRVAGSVEGFKYSNAMAQSGVTWDDDTLAAFFAAPRNAIKGTRMAFAGLKKDDEIADVIAYLTTFSAAATTETKAEAPTENDKPAEEVAATTTEQVQTSGERSKGAFGLGRLATAAEVSAWDIDIRPDGKGLPVGRGTVAMGEPLYTDNCAACHGDFGEAVGRWPVLAGGFDTLTRERPEKTIGSYWPYLSTVYDYVRRAMPFGNARMFSDDEVYALTAYLLYLNDIVDDEEFELSNDNFSEITMPNAGNFIPDERADEPHYASKAEPCMADCKPGAVEITMRARILDVTPDSSDDDQAGAGAIE